MNNYSIADLQQLSGIKAHTIRIWEQRYQTLKPKRSEGNTRYYDDNQLRRLLNIVSLSEAGLKVSELSSLPDKKLADLLEENFGQQSTANSPHEYFISQLIIAGLHYDEVTFDKLFSACILRFGMRNTFLEIIYPVLSRIGLMWGKDTLSPAQEHFMSCLIRQKLSAATDVLSPVLNSEQTWLLFLPFYESHEIGLLLTNYLLRANGHKVIYLGANVPLESIKQAVKNTTPSHLFFFMVHSLPIHTAQEYVHQIKKIAPKEDVFLSGNLKIISQLELPKKMKFVPDVETFEKNMNTDV